MSGLFTSKLIYGITAWGSVFGIPGQTEDSRSAFPKKDILRLQTLPNKAIRMLFYRDRRTPTKDLLKEANQLSVNQLIAFHILLQTFKIKVSQQPSYHYHRLFEIKNNKYETRSSNIKRVEFRLNIGRSSFFFQASRLWLSLPRELTECSSENSFKMKLKDWIIDNIPTKP